MPFNFFTDIAGSSPTDVWACGPGGDLDKTLYHFDGQNWKSDLITRPFSPLAIYAVSKNEVWSCGLQGNIGRYSNSEWGQIHQELALQDTIIDLITMHKQSSLTLISTGQYFVNNDFYGLILKSNTDKWERLEIPEI